MIFKSIYKQIYFYFNHTDTTQLLIYVVICNYVWELDCALDMTQLQETSTLIPPQVLCQAQSESEATELNLMSHK